MNRADEMRAPTYEVRSSVCEACLAGHVIAHKHTSGVKSAQACDVMVLEESVIMPWFLV
jgi:hypothetical protein